MTRQYSNLQESGQPRACGTDNNRPVSTIMDYTPLPRGALLLAAWLAAAAPAYGAHVAPEAPEPAASSSREGQRLRFDLRLRDPLLRPVFSSAELGLPGDQTYALTRITIRVFDEWAGDDEHHARGPASLWRARGDDEAARLRFIGELDNPLLAPGPEVVRTLAARVAPGALVLASLGDPLRLDARFVALAELPPSAVPLPPGLPLMLAGLAGLTLLSRRRAKG